MAIIYDSRVQEGFTYTPVDQRGDKNPFSVTIKPIASRDMIKLQDNLLQRDNEDKISLKTGTYNLKACKLGIVNWSGILDKDSVEIQMKKDFDGYISDSSLDIIPTRYFDEIAGVIIHVSQDPKAIDTYLETPAKK